MADDPRALWPLPAAIIDELDLVVTVDAPHGGTSKLQISGAGDEVVVQVEELSPVSSSLGRRRLAQVAEAAAAADLTVHVIGRRGRVATVGSAVFSRWGAWLAGTPRVALAPGRETASTALALIPLAVRRASILFTGAAALGVTARMLRRRPTRENQRTDR